MLYQMYVFFRISTYSYPFILSFIHIFVHSIMCVFSRKYIYMCVCVGVGPGPTGGSRLCISSSVRLGLRRAAQGGEGGAGGGG